MVKKKIKKNNKERYNKELIDKGHVYRQYNN